MKKQAMRKDTSLNEPQQVVMEYLDALLSEIEPVALDVVEPVQEQVSTEPAVETLREAKTIVANSEVPVFSEGAEPLASDEFQILLFDVSGVKFAVPLDNLNGILEWSDEVTAMPNRSDWFLGILAERERQIKVIDTAIVVVPSKFRGQHDPNNLKKIILIGDSCWGLACDAVSEVVTLNRKDVRWRNETTKRPWLAGTVIEHMCALLDADEFASMLGSDQLEPAD